MQATERNEEICPACRAMLADSRAPEAPTHLPDEDRHCACCDDTLLRDVSPPVSSAPRGLAVELPFLAWLAASPMHVSPSQVWHEQQSHLQALVLPLAQRVPFFRLHEAWLL